MSERPRLDEATLRETKDNLVGAVTEQQRRGGAGVDLPADPVGNTRAAEDFVNPILEKVARDRYDEDRRDMVRAKQAPAAQSRDGVDVTEAGTWNWNLETDEVTPIGPVPDDVRHILAPRKHHPAIEAAKRRLHFIRVAPDDQKLDAAMRLRALELREEVYRIIRTPMHKAAREKLYRSVLAKSVRAFGNPMHEKPGDPTWPAG